MRKPLPWDVEVFRLLHLATLVAGDYDRVARRCAQQALKLTKLGDAYNKPYFEAVVKVGMSWLLPEPRGS